MARASSLPLNVYHCREHVRRCSEHFSRNKRDEVVHVRRSQRLHKSWTPRLPLHAARYVHTGSGRHYDVDSLVNFSSTIHNNARPNSNNCLLNCRSRVASFEGSPNLFRRIVTSRVGVQQAIYHNTSVCGVVHQVAAGARQPGRDSANE